MRVVECRAAQIIHRSLIDQFIVKRVLAPGGGNPSDLTLADILADSEMKAVFDNTFVIVKKQATLAEAKSAMDARKGCSDLFVTAAGNPNEPVLGYLTNVDIARTN